MNLSVLQSQILSKNQKDNLPMSVPLRKKIKKFTRRLLQSPLVIGILSTIIRLYVTLVGKTTRWQTDGIGRFYQTWEKEGSLIFIGWHGRLLMLPYFYNRSRRLNALVSLHHDGRLIASLLNKFGFGTIGGSTTENGKNAALELMRSMQHGEAIAIIPDGPKGPNMTLSRSAVYYAWKTGKPILGATYSIKGSKIIDKSWDKMMLPLPFSQGEYLVTEPFYIPQDTPEEELETHRRRIELALNQLTWDADKRMGIKHIEPGSVARKRYPAAGEK